MKWKESGDLPHWQVEGSGSMSESLNDTKTLLTPEGHKKEVEVEALGPASGRHSTIRMLEPGKEPHPLSTRLERRLPWRRTPLLVCLKGNAEA